MSSNTCVVVCTDLWSKELHRQVGVGIVVTSGSLHGVMVSTLARTAKGVCSIPFLGTIFPIFITFMTLFAMTMILYKLHIVSLLNLLCMYVYICKAIACIKKTYNSREMSVIVCTDRWGKELHR